MKEWIDYNLLIGVEHFWLYNNDSTDNYQAVLKPYIDQGTVELFYWPDTTPEIWFPYGCQAAAYRDGLERARSKTNWLAFIDTDEFIVPKKGYSLSKLLNNEFKHECGVVLYWQKFGTSHVGSIDKNELMIEKLTLKAPQNHKVNFWFKSIVKVKYVKTIDNPHCAEYIKKYTAVNTKKQKVDREAEKLFSTDLIQINHYWTRDEEFLLNVKCARYLNWNAKLNEILEQASQLNQEYDDEIQKFIPMLKLMK